MGVFTGMSGKDIALVAGGATTVVLAGGLITYNLLLSSGQRDAPGIGSVLSRGSLKKEKVAGGIDGYNTHFAHERGSDAIFAVDIKKLSTPAFVDMFYNLVTDFYEYGWGQSFHFAPKNKGESFNDCIERHEQRIGDAVALKPGMTCIDCGCGVGGPMRAIAKHTGANMVGITINDYQVGRCTEHNKAAGLDGQCKVVQGSFLEMPFPANSFDGAVCIEAACHAPVLADLYKQVFKVLKPGAMFASYEWLTTDLYDPSNPHHVDMIAGLNEGNALPGIRDLAMVKAAAAEAGFEVVLLDDYALGGDIPWHAAMRTARFTSYITHAFSWCLETIGWAPKGTVAVHEMLIKAAYCLEVSGQLGIFTPMYLAVLRKPKA